MAWTESNGVYTVTFSELNELLTSLPDNTIETPYKLNITNLTPSILGDSRNTGTLGDLLKNNPTKYVDLRNTEIPLDVTSLRWSFSSCNTIVFAFSDYHNVKNMEFCFKDCQSLLEFKAYTGVRQLQACFSGCTSLVSFICLEKYNNLLTSISSCFEDCTSLEEIELNIKKSPSCQVYNRLFMGCSSLKKVSLKIDNGDYTVQLNASEMFKNCTQLENVNIILQTETTFTNMTYMFYNCPVLRTINVNDNVFSYVLIQDNCFYGCNSLQEIKLIPPEEIIETDDYKVYLLSFESNPDINVSVFNQNGDKQQLEYITWRNSPTLELKIQGKTDEFGIFPSNVLTDEIIKLSITSNSHITTDNTKPNLLGKNIVLDAFSPKNFFTNIIFPDGVTTECKSSANDENKEIVLSSWTDSGLPNRCNIDVTFTNENSYGETTIANPTHPKLIVKNATGDTIGTFDICDSRGHFAGKGCWNAGDLICFKRSGNKMLMTNHDVREATSDYKIYSDNYLLQVPTKISDLQNDSGLIDSDAYVKGVKDYNNNNPIEIGYSGASLAYDEVAYLAGYKYGSSLGEPYIIKDVSFDVVKDKLGINVLSKLFVDDTRSTNKDPRQYDRGIYFEFKYSSAINNPFGYTYCLLVTMRAWGYGIDLSGGNVVQYAIANNELRVRYSTDSDMWSSWGRLNPTSAMTSPIQSSSPSPTPVLSEDN